MDQSFNSRSLRLPLSGTLTRAEKEKAADRQLRRSVRPACAPTPQNAPSECMKVRQLDIGEELIYLLTCEQAGLRHLLSQALERHAPNSISKGQSECFSPREFVRRKRCVTSVLCSESRKTVSLLVLGSGPVRDHAL
jgi:hypothetical protein